MDVEAAHDTTANEIDQLKQKCFDLEMDNLGLLDSLESVTIRADSNKRKVRDMEGSIKYLGQVREYLERRVAELELKVCCIRFEYESKLAALEDRLDREID